MSYSSTYYSEFTSRQAALVKGGITPPFDPRRVICTTTLIFEYDAVGPLVGDTAEFLGGTLTNLAGETHLDQPPLVGQIIMHANNRVVLYIEGLDLYLGWLEEHEYRVIDTTYPSQPQRLQ